jgi:hypothetical protein
MPPVKSRRCESCNEIKPAKQFLPTSLNPTGYLAKCMDCIKLAAMRHRRSQAEAGLPVVIPTAVRRQVAYDVPAVIPTAVRPLQTRMAPHLVQAAIRFFAEYQPGVERPIDLELEPELRDLLLWLRELSLKEAIAPQKPEEIGRAILNYKDDRMARGVTYGALWAALVRASAIYATQDALTAKNRVRVD